MSGAHTMPPRVTPAPTQSGCVFMPYYVFRRGTVPFAALSALVPQRTWAALDDLDRVRKARARYVQSLLDCLYTLVPAVSTPERAALLALQRDLYNNRPSRDVSVTVARRHLADPEAALLAEIESDLRREQADRDGLRRLLTDELQEARRAMAQLASMADVRDGVQLSGMWLNRAVGDYIRDVLRPGGSARCSGSAERSLTSILYRVALKPSPFGSFTEIGAGRWATAVPADECRLARPRVARLGRMLLIWLERELERVEECREHLPLRPNNTVLSTGEHVEFLTRGTDGTEQMLGGERVIRIRRTPLIDVVLDEARSAGATRAKVTARLFRAGFGKDANAGQRVRDAVELLVEVGLLERSLGIPDQEPRYARRMSMALRGVPGDTARTCRNALSALSSVEDAFPQASTARREELLKTVQTQVDRVTTVVGAQQLSLATVRSPIFEDVGATSAATSWQPRLLDRNRHRFELLQRLLPLFDDTTLEGLGAFELFRHVFGEESRGASLLDFYRRFAQLDRRTISGYMSGQATPAGRTVLELRRRFFDQILAPSPTPAPPHGEMNTEQVSDFVDTFPSHVPPWDSATYRIQFLGTADADAGANDGGIVINGVTTGFGAGFSRFCDVVDKDASPFSLQAALRASAQDSDQAGRQADLVAVLGMNYNLHPPVGAVEIEYPRCRAAAADSEVLSLRDLRVVPDGGRRRLVLVNAHDESPLRLVPLNLLFPAAGPSLYRFLSALSALIAYRVGLWERFEAYDAGLSPRCYPRLTLGPIVIERRTWRLPRRHLPPVPHGPDAVDLLLATDAWRRQLGLPATAFVKLSQPLPKRRDVDWVEEKRRWAVSARRGRRHKPQFVDFRNPFLTSVLFASFPAIGDWSLLVQESLPPAATYLGEEGPDSAEEFLVEVRRPIGGSP